MSQKTYAYIRVSAVDQNADRQLVAMQQFRIPLQNIHIDKQSGKNFDRPAYKRLMKKLKAGDILYIKSIDRLGRNYEEIMNQWRIITKETGADIVVLDMELLDTRRDKNLLGTFIADLVLQVLSFVAQNEREAIRQRQAEGIAAARARGVSFGRQPQDIPHFNEVVEKWKRGEINATEAAKFTGLSRRGFYKRVEREQKSGN